MADETTIDLRNCQVLTVGDGAIVLQKGESTDHVYIPATIAAEQWAGAHLYQFVDVSITMGPAK